MECKVCYKVFISLDDAGEHYRAYKSHENFDIYTKNKPYKCVFCNARFSIQTDFEDHEKIHEKLQYKQIQKYEIPEKQKEIFETHQYSKKQTKSCAFEQTKHLENHMVRNISKNSDFAQTLDIKLFPLKIIDSKKKFTDLWLNHESSNIYGPADGSDVADIRVVELDAKTIELSSSEDDSFDKKTCSKEKYPNVLNISESRNILSCESDDYPIHHFVSRKELLMSKKKVKNITIRANQFNSKNQKIKNVSETTLKKRKKISTQVCGEDVLITADKNLEKQSRTEENYNNLASKHRCSTCGERRNNKRLLQQHKQVHNGLEETECKVCRMVFGTPQEVLLHFDSFKKNKQDKHYRESRPYQCKDCDSRFIHLKHLYEHRKIHIGDKKYLCKICGKSFLRKQGLQWHLETHLSEELDAKSIENLQGIKVRDNVLNKKVFVCDICGHEFKQSSQLKIHINRHVKLKRFSCTVCTKSFVTPRDLLKHSRTHTGERPYKCSFCEKSFIDSGDRIKHERLHTGEKPYSCQTCGKKFTFSSGLRTHERAVHFGLKRYNCDKCTRGFSNKSCLLKHKTKIHLLM